MKENPTEIREDVERKKHWLITIAEEPFSHVLLTGASDFEASDIESLCLAYSIMVTPCSLDHILGSAVRTPLDVVVLSLDDLDQSSEQLSNQLCELGAPVLCILPPPESMDTEWLSKLSVEDFIFRPYRPEELICRLQAVLARRRRNLNALLVEKRHSERRKEVGAEASCDSKGLIVDQKRKCILLDGHEVSLTPMEYRLLSLLATEPGRVFSVEEIIPAVWQTSKRASATDVQQYVHLLRRKIELDPHSPEFILTVPGFGYMLETAN